VSDYCDIQVGRVPVGINMHMHMLNIEISFIDAEADVVTHALAYACRSALDRKLYEVNEIIMLSP